VKERLLMKGNEALAEAAIRAGCRCFFGYPITPQNEIPEYMAKRMPQVGGVFLQAESEVSAINMVYGAAGAGVRAMTSSSSPGISLKQEGISYMAGAELPCVVVNVMRAGPGLGGIQAAQGDYFQATRGGGHGDYYTLVLAPGSVQEMMDLTFDAFDLADKYRNPVLILCDAILGQMMEPVELKDEFIAQLQPKPWATVGAKGREPNIINSFYVSAEEQEEHNIKLFTKYQRMRNEEVRVETWRMEDAELAIVAYGTVSRIAKAAVELMRQEGIKAGLIRPITLFPFPEKIIHDLAFNVKAFLVTEMSLGQLVEDVRLAVEGVAPVKFYGTAGGRLPTHESIFQKACELMNELKRGENGCYEKIIR
jgi:2-oxoglutarate ferredoxin oxidoreductase subunit alpha